jgi:hypothetical protein
MASSTPFTATHPMLCFFTGFGQISWKRYSMQVSKDAWHRTKYGFIHLLRSRIWCLHRDEPHFWRDHKGIIGVNKKGQVLSVNVDQQTVIPCIIPPILNNTEVTFKLPSRGNLPGADDLYIKRYQQLFQGGQYGEAAKIAATSPRVLSSQCRTLMILVLSLPGNSAHCTSHRVLQDSPSTSGLSVSHLAVLRHPPREGRA